MDMFRELSPAEEEDFRQWARDNYEPNMEVNPTWHPVVRDEIELIRLRGLPGFFPERRKKTSS